MMLMMMLMLLFMIFSCWPSVDDDADDYVHNYDNDNIMIRMIITIMMLL